MNIKVLVATILFIGFTISAQAQTAIASGEDLIKELEKKAERQRAAEKADPTLSKNRPGRIATKEEKKELEKARRAKREKMAKAMKGMKDKKMKVSKSKYQHPQPTKGTTKKIKIKE